MYPQLWLEEQHRAFKTPSHSALRELHLAVNSAHNTLISFSL